MRIVTLEEHFNVPSLASKIPPNLILARGNPPPDHAPDMLRKTMRELADLGQARLDDMDANGISVQVLSWAGPGADLLPPDKAVGFAREANDILAQTIAAHPGRYAGFAHLPMTAPDASSDELERCVRDLGFKGAMVNGLTDGKFLDHSLFEPLLARAEALDVPMYIHPNIPPSTVREAYYSGLPGSLDFVLSTYGFGWHAEVAIHLLRLVFNGTLERHPRLKVIIGHMGELLPMTLARIENMASAEAGKFLTRSITEQIRDQVWITTAGQFTLPPLRALIDTFGIDRVLFSVDYPYSSNAEGKALLNMLPYAPLDCAKIMHGNADRLLKLSA